MPSIMNAALIGKPVKVVAQMAGFDLPDTMVLFVAPLKEVAIHALL